MTAYDPIEDWRLVWRDGFAPTIPTRGLIALRDALRADDQRLIQGATSIPPPLMCVQDWPVEAACAVGFCGWQGEQITLVGEVEEYFARTCYDASARVGHEGACRWFLNAWDDTPRSVIFPLLLAEVEYELGKRGLINPPPADSVDQGAHRVGEPGGLAAGDAA